MKFTCDQCERRYTIPDEKVRGRSVKVRCKGCQAVLTVGPLPEAPPPEPAPLAEAGGWDDEPTRAAAFAFYVMVDGQQEGPLGLPQLLEKVSSGVIGPDTYVWADGMPDWLPAGEVPQIAPLVTRREEPRAQAPAPAAAVPQVAAGPAPTVEPAMEPGSHAEPDPAMQLNAPAVPEPAPAGSAETDFQAEDLPWSGSPNEGAQERAAASGAELGDLFSDLDLRASGERAAFPGKERSLSEEQMASAPPREARATGGGFALGGGTGAGPAPSSSSMGSWDRDRDEGSNAALKIVLLLLVLVIAGGGLLWALDLLPF